MFCLPQLVDEETLRATADKWKHLKAGFEELLGYTQGMIAVTIRAWGLMVQVEATESYPDAAQDIANRAVEAFAEAVNIMQKSEVPIFDPELADPDGED